MRNSALLIFLFIAKIAFSQNHDAYWHIGYKVMLKFSDSGLICLDTVPSISDHTMVSYSGADGNLWFYGNGSKLYNSFNEFLSNSNLNIGDYNPAVDYSVQDLNKSIVLPKPGNDNIAFIINNTGECEGNLGDYVYSGMAYTVFDKTLNSGVGDIDTLFKNIEFNEDFLGDCIIATKHANGRDWWLIAHRCTFPDSTTNEFVKYMIDPDGFHGPFYQSIGILEGRGNQNTQITISNDGSKLCLLGEGNNIEVFYFDRCTGDLSEFVSFHENYYAIGAQFSPDGSKLYTAKSSAESSRIYQYDLTAGATSEDVKNSRVSVFNFDITDHVLGGYLTMGQDNRIYFTTVYGYDTGPLTPVTDYNTYLSVITNPNESGADCNVEPYSIWLCNGLLAEGVPNMPNYRLGALQGSECDTLSTAMQIEIPAQDVFTIYPNPVSTYIEIQHNKQEPLTIIIRDMQGRVCLLLQSFTEAIIQVENFASGVYAITAINDKTGIVFTEKFVKN